MNSRKKKFCVLLSTVITCVPRISLAAETNSSLNIDFLKSKRSGSKSSGQTYSLTFEDLMECLRFSVHTVSFPKTPNDVCDRFIFNKRSNKVYFPDFMDLLSCLGNIFKESKCLEDYRKYGEVLCSAIFYKQDSLLMAQDRASLLNHLNVSFELEHLVACSTLIDMIENKIDINLGNCSDGDKNSVLDQIKTINGLDDKDAKDLLERLIMFRKERNSIMRRDIRLFKLVIDKLRYLSNIANNNMPY